MVKKQEEVKEKTKTKTIKKESNNKKEEIKEQSLLVSILELVGIILAIIIILVFFKNTVIWNIVILLLMLTVLIFVHEGGHFIMGKKFGVHIYEFALGMGPKVLGFKRKNDPTEYTLRALPIGGFCQMAGEEGEDDAKLKKDKFMCNKGKIQRTLILCAGVFMNFVTAIVILFFISLIWGSSDQSSLIGHVEKDSPAYKEGIVKGDKIIECNGYKISNWDKLSVVTSLKSKHDYIEYKIEHKDGSVDTYKLVPEEYVVVEDEYIKITKENTKEDIIKEHKLNKDEVQVTKLIGISSDGKIKHGFVNAIKYAFKKFTSLVGLMIMIVGNLIIGKLGLSSLSGPVGMYTVTATVAQYGIANILYLMAYLSINLGVLNILPFPAFDGGRVLFVAIEAITGKKVDSKVEAWFHTIGFILIMLLMLYITFQDIIKLF